MNNDRLNFRAWNKVTLTDDEDNDYEKSFMLYNVDAFKGHRVGIFEEDFEDQLKKQGFSEDEIEQIECDYSSEPCDDYLNIDADEIDQCTGLKDKNGRLIYEGDIIKTPSLTYLLKVDVFNVLACIERDFSYRVDWSRFVADIYHEGRQRFIEVIGNIHENPELFK